MAELAIILVSHNSGDYLAGAISSLDEHTGELSVELCVVDNGSDGAGRSIQSRPGLRVLACENQGFGHACNLGLAATDAPFVLFLNPDLQIVDGSLETLVAMLRDDPRKGLVGARELTPQGDLVPTMRFFPSPGRELVEALGLGGRPVAGRWLGERRLDASAYGARCRADWVPGSFMLLRRECLERVGSFDERFFLYCEEIDLCLRITRAGWEVWYAPDVTFRHDQGHGSRTPQLEAQLAFARIQYARRHLALPQRIALRGSLVLRYSLRAAACLLPRWRAQRPLYAAGLRAALGIGGRPFAPASR